MSHNKLELPLKFPFLFEKGGKDEAIFGVYQKAGNTIISNSGFGYLVGKFRSDFSLIFLQSG